MPLYVYILASEPQGTLYVGVTNNLIKRVAEHKAKLVPGFTKKYGVDKLVYFEQFEDNLAAMAARLEALTHRRAKPALAGFVSRIESVSPVGPGSALRAVRDDIVVRREALAFRSLL